MITKTDIRVAIIAALVAAGISIGVVKCAGPKPNTPTPTPTPAQR